MVSLIRYDAIRALALPLCVSCKNDRVFSVLSLLLLFYSIRLYNCKRVLTFNTIYQTSCSDFGAMNQRYPLKEITVYKGMIDVG